MKENSPKKQAKKLIFRERMKFTAIAAGAIVAVLLAIWFILSPALQMRQRAEYQAELLTSITEGDGTMAVRQPADGDADFYDDGPDAPQVEVMAFLPDDSNVEASGDTGTVNGLGVLTIDKINLKLPVAEGVSKTQLNIAVGHVPQTPAIGDIGNAVIAGHRSYEHGMFFNRLGEVSLGDTIQYQPKDGNLMAFIVDDILEINPGDQSAFDQPDDKAQITLYTCTPIKEATHRLLIRATLAQ